MSNEPCIIKYQEPNRKQSPMSKLQKHFYEKVYKAVQKIPKGRVSTYGLIAKVVGSPKAARAVGSAMKCNARPFYKKCQNKVPCHRVVKSDGTLGGFTGGLSRKIRLLKDEGIIVKGNRIVDFKKVISKNRKS